MNIVTKTILGLGIALGAITQCLAGGETATFSESSYGEPRFFCDEQQQSTVLRSHWGDIPLITWIDPSFPPPWTPLQRCREVTARFNRFNDNGTLKYMRGAMMGNYPVICVAGYKGGSCLDNGLLITLKYGSDPNLALTKIIDRRMWATSGSVYLSDGENGDELISKVNGTVYFDIGSLLDKKE